MKKVLIVLSMLASASLLTNCGSSNNNARQANNRMARGTGNGGAGAQNAGIPGAVGTASNPNVPANAQATANLGWGVITPGSSQSTIAFLSTDFVNGQVGNTTNDNGPCTTGPGLQSSPCAVMFTVTTQSNALQVSPLTLQGGTLSSLYNSGGAPLSNGFLTMIIWDSMSGNTSPNGSMYTPIPVVIPVVTQNSIPQGGIADPYGVSGYAGGQTVNLVFGDQEGFVQFTGTINGNQLTGNINFQNAVNANGGTGLNGTLGGFTINVCDIIQCS